ncbi:MAG: hypothetical protein ACRDQH_04995 [Pseudonocardiaceae bacterium]
MAEWSFITKHARALVCIARDPGVRLREIADVLGVTERRAFGIFSDLTEAGYVVKERDGRRNRYRIRRHLPLRVPVGREPTIGELLGVLVDAGATDSVPAPGQTAAGRRGELEALPRERRDRPREDDRPDQTDAHRAPGRLSRQGPPALSWALYEAAQRARFPASPDRSYYEQTAARIDGNQPAPAAKPTNTLDTPARTSTQNSRPDRAAAPALSPRQPRASGSRFGVGCDLSDSPVAAPAEAIGCRR